MSFEIRKNNPRIKRCKSQKLIKKLKKISKYRIKKLTLHPTNVIYTNGNQLKRILLRLLLRLLRS